jgi:threonine-phosphate decarboxylase
MSLSSLHGGDVWLVERALGLRAENVIDFSSNVNPYGPSLKAIKALLDKVWMLSAYPDDGAEALKERLAEHYGLKSSNFVVGNGSTEIIYMFSMLVVKEGPVGMHIPTFSEYERAVVAYGGRCLFTRPHVYDQPSVEELVELMGRGARALFLCNPNNPNGAVMRPDDVEELLCEADKRGVYVLLDEDFVELADESSARSFASEVERFNRLVVLRSFSKSHGLAGLRVGYAIASEEVVERLESLRIRWNVSLLAQEAAIAALDDVEHVEAARRLVRQEKPRLVEELGEVGWLKPIYGYANFLLLELTERFTSPGLKVELAQRGLLVRDCSNFRGLNDKYVRVAVKRPWENERLVRALKELSDD